MQVSKEEFLLCQQKIGNIPFEQSREWLEYKERNDVEFLYFVDYIDDPAICCWGRVQNKKFVGKILDIQGESMRKGITPKLVNKFYESLISDKFSLILINSISKYDVDFEISLRRAGFNRPLGNSVCPLTIFVNTQGDRKPARIWSRNIKKSLTFDLSFAEIISPTMEDAKIFSDMFGELAETKHLSYLLDATKIFNLLKSDNYKLFFVYKEGKPVCGRIVYINGDCAADVYAANADESRTCCATYLIMERIFEYLKGIGVKEFDFSRIPPSNNETDSVYIFKNFSGGKAVQYNGEWMWAKKKHIPLMFAIYNFYFRKAHHY